MKKRKKENLDVGSFCGKGVHFNGALRVEGTIHFDGNIDGELEVDQGRFTMNPIRNRDANKI